MKAAYERYAIESSPLRGARRVFLARRQSDATTVILKTIDPARSSPRHVAALQHEFSVLSRLQGAPVARPVELIDDGDVCLVFLLPLDHNHRLLDELLAREESAVDPAYGFVHDRVQQAAYATMVASERTAMHLRIGRMLLSSLSEAEASDERLFKAVTQLNSGREHVVDPAERASLARLNLRAAERAMRASAHASALELATRCLELLGAHP
jgi:hypothetical protein